jgi:hypothetical protein
MPITQIMMMKTNFERNILVCLLSFLGISAATFIAGGLAFTRANEAKKVETASACTCSSASCAAACEAAGECVCSADNK